MDGITSHLGHKVILGSSLYSFSDFDIGMTPCDLELFLGGMGFSRKTAVWWWMERSLIGQRMSVHASVGSSIHLLRLIFGQAGMFGNYVLAQVG